MIKKIALFCLIFIMLHSFAFCEVSVKADVDKLKVTTDEDITYKVTVVNSGKIVPKIKFPKFEGFKVVSQAQSSTISFVKSNVETILIYAYILRPLAAGKYTIGPVEAVNNNKTYKSDSFEIEVSQGSSSDRNTQTTPGLKKNPSFEGKEDKDKITL